MASHQAVLERVPTSLEKLGLDEAWLEHWIQEDPKRLGLGSRLRVLKSQVTKNANSSSGRLDLQLVDDDLEDRVYDIELQRGELDASHGFRALDYWAREQKDDEAGRQHFPVIIAEQIRGSRYWTLLQALAEAIDLLALEVRSILVEGKPVIWIEPALLPSDLYPDTDGTVAKVKGQSNEADWRKRTTDDFQKILRALEERAKSLGLTYTVNWSAKSYIGLWKNSRCWCPIWPRKDAARLYLPAPTEWGEGGETAPPEGFPAVEKAFADVGITLVWSWSYNMGSNPVAVTVDLADLDKPEVKNLLQASWKAVP